jgi:hypothetical protein
MNVYHTGMTYSKLKEWARYEFENGNRVKASHISRVAERVRQRLLKHYKQEPLPPRPTRTKAVIK